MTSTPSTHLTTSQEWEKYKEAVEADCMIYFYIDEDGTKVKDLALPIGWVKEFIKMTYADGYKKCEADVAGVT